MKISHLLCTWTLSLASVSCVGQAKGDTFMLFYLGGQSNMEGFGYNKELPSELNQPLKDVFIFDGTTAADGDENGGKGKWEALKPGHGTGFSSDGKTNTLSERFGPELTFGRRMKELYPDAKIAIVKYVRGGTSIDSLAAGGAGCWDPHFSKINQYDHFLTTLENARFASDVNGDGKADVLVPAGIVWMQGESDGVFSQEIADRYFFQPASGNRVVPGGIAGSGIAGGDWEDFRFGTESGEKNLEIRGNRTSCPGKVCGIG